MLLEPLMEAENGGGFAREDLPVAGKEFEQPPGGAGSGFGCLDDPSKKNLSQSSQLPFRRTSWRSR